MLLYSKGNPEADLSAEDLKEGLYSALDKLGSRKRFWQSVRILRVSIRELGAYLYGMAILRR